MMTNHLLINVYKYILIWIVLTQYYISTQDCPVGQFNCMGMCLDSKAKCPVAITCPDELIKINLYTCAVNDDFRVPSKCKTGEECWDGSCTTNKTENCPTMSTCPSVANVHCPDNSCVDSIEKCPKYFECPSFIPIRCPNGDCRNSLEDCPSLIKCPTQFSMLCNDGSCRMISDDCEVPSLQTQCEDTSMVRCSDGTCTTSKFLCPAQTTCPPGYVKCWDGNCALKGKCKQPNEGQSYTCGELSLVLCAYDYSCKADISLCPTGMICPVSKPVKCWDGSCKESIHLCPEFQECPVGMTSCPDGSCTSGSCGTHITCSKEAPFKCYDNTCKRNPEDCPEQPNCPSETPILCWDGRCLSERGDCTSPTITLDEPTTKAICPDGSIVTNINECNETPDCPAQFNRCPSGECRIHIRDCPEQRCPLNFPYQCDNGLCVSDVSHCEHDNGCPFNYPIKCEDGSCVKDSCSNVHVESCGVNTRLCPDGSCLPLETTCPLANGCPVDTPRLCADGTCIDPKKDTCAIPICPIDTPIKCLDGLCVSTQSNCPQTTKASKLNNNDLIYCADGREAFDFEECKPVFECETGHRCEDGSCRDEPSYCPRANTCPNGQKRCKNGACVAEESDCIDNDVGCPNKTSIKCSDSGLCVSNEEECKAFNMEFASANGCAKATPIKCVTNNKCVAVESDCGDDNGCPTDNPVLCDDGICVAYARMCMYHPATCADTFVECPNDIVPCASSYDECFNNLNCKLSNPFRCLNGECKRYPLQHDNTDSDGCSIGIECPQYKPFLCGNGECVENSSFCTSLNECPPDKNIRCFDRTCAESHSQCELYGKKCPVKSPIMCMNSNCVSNIFDCIEMDCPSWKPYKCLNGKCKATPRECLESPNNEYNTICNVANGDEVVCYDGSCRKNFDSCPLYAGCTSSSAPFKCNDGTCVQDQSQCNTNNTVSTRLTQYNDLCTEEGKVLCEDGICRQTCPEYNGCPFTKPLMCSTGRCVSTISECVGESNCADVDKPFRCIDGSCKASISECISTKRAFGTTNIKLSVFSEYDQTADVIVGDDNLLLGSVYVPSDSIRNENIEGDNQSGVILIKSVPRSRIQHTYSQYHETRSEDLIKVFPYADPLGNGHLEYEHTVLSSVLNISLEHSVKFTKSILLNLIYDFPSQHETLTTNTHVNAESQTNDYMLLDPLEDVCLAKLNNDEWNCVDLPFTTESLDNFIMKASINETGTYAVILHLRINTSPLHIEAHFLIENLYSISAFTIIMLIIIGIGTYIFTRIYRYRAKYKESSEKVKERVNEIQNMQTSSSFIPGQTIGDVKAGLVFTDNPAYKMISDTEKSKRTIQLESLHEKYTKRLRTLERNNTRLKESLDSIKGEYDRLYQYKQSLMQVKGNDNGLLSTG